MGAPKSELREYLEAILVALLVAAFIITFVAQVFLVQGASMEPTLHDGQRLLVDKVTYRFRSPQRGEIIVFRYPADPRRKFIKRVIAVAGDEIVFQRGRVVLNGRPLAEDYTRGPTEGSGLAYTVPPGHLYVLGDNRRHSDDSRFRDVGAVDLSLVVGRALVVFWPPTHFSLLEVPGIFAQEP